MWATTVLRVIPSTAEPEVLSLRDSIHATQTQVVASLVEFVPVPRSFCLFQSVLPIPSRSSLMFSKYSQCVGETWCDWTQKATWFSDFVSETCPSGIKIVRSRPLDTRSGWSSNKIYCFRTFARCCCTFSADSCQNLSKSDLDKHYLHVLSQIPKQSLCARGAWNLNIFLNARGAVLENLKSQMCAV